MKKLLLAAMVVVTAIIIVSFSTRNAKHSETQKGKNLDYQLFQFNGEFGEEGDYTKYDWIVSAPTECTNTGSVCYIEALRASEDDEDPNYLHPQFDVSEGFPDVDMDKVVGLTQKQGPIK